MHDDYETYYDPDVNQVTGKKKLTGDPTRKTAHHIGNNTRYRVDTHLPEEIKEPSLDEGVAFVQKMGGSSHY